MDIEARLKALEQRLERLEGKKVEVAKPSVQPAAADELAQLQALLPLWPAAVDPTLICDSTSDQDKEDRAEGILDLIIDTKLTDLAILDVGCGEGHLVVKSLEQKPRRAVGYDLAAQQWERWPSDERLTHTTDWTKVRELGPYEIVILYDVLDHIPGDNEVVVLDLLHRIRQVLSPGGTVFVRCHPFCSRHATHLYHHFNKAYAHLVFTAAELKAMGFGQGLPTRLVIHPLNTYRHYFGSSHYRIIREHVVKEPVEPFFINEPLITKRLRQHWQQSPQVELATGRDFPLYQVEQQFLDYVLQ